VVKKLIVECDGYGAAHARKNYLQLIKLWSFSTHHRSAMHIGLLGTHSRFARHTQISKVKRQELKNYVKIHMNNNKLRWVVYV